MKTKFTVLALGLLFNLSGCGSGNKGNSAAYQEGSDLCSFSYVVDFNELNRSVARAKSADEAHSLINAFEAKYRDVRCMAEDQTTGAKEYVSTNDQVARLRGAIANVTKDANNRKAVAALREANKPQPVTTVPPVAVGNPSAAVIDANIEDLRAVSLEIVDASAITRLKNSRDTLVIQNGKLVDHTTAAAIGSSICLASFIASTETGSTFIFAQSQISTTLDGRLRIMSDTTIVVCGRLSDSKKSPWTVNEVQAIFGKILNVNPIRR